MTKASNMETMRAQINDIQNNVREIARQRDEYRTDLEALKVEYEATCQELERAKMRIDDIEGRKNKIQTKGSN